jgi:hypothetical protein
MAHKSITRNPYDPEGQAAEDEAQVESAKQRKAQEEDDIKWLMGHAAGRRIASRILGRTHVRKTSFNASGSVMAFSEGERNVGLWFEAQLLTAAPDGYLKLLKEYASE